MIPLHRSRGAASFLLRSFLFLILAALILTLPGVARAQAADPGPRWTLDLSLPARASGKFSDPAVQVELAPTAAGLDARLAGTGLDALRRVLFTDLRGQLAVDGGFEVRIQARAVRGQRLELTLDANPSTGYVWDWGGLDPAHFTLVGEPALLPPSGAFRLGAPQRLTAALEAAADGDLAAVLAYRRPWRADAPRVRLSIQADELPPALDLSDPNPPAASGLDLSLPGPQPLPQEEIPGEPQSLPASFDWRATGRVSAVRDQGNCGSCWAFGAVGVLESALKVQLNAGEKDLSEQFLVNCNNYGYGCDGGWWDAHDFHYDTVRSPQVEPGSVNESQLPYTAQDGSCATNYAKTYRLTRWQYLNYETPDVTAIKEAILSYGPVGTAVCVGNAFAGYDGGVFATNENCGQAVVNHAVVLVGWDDSTQSWIMKNSWDTWWGEAGYMRIRYGTSQIGFWANYAVVQPTPPALLAPAAGAVVAGLRPELSWQAVSDAQEYQVQVSTGSGFSTTLFNVTLPGLAYTPTADLAPNGLYYWRARALMSSGYSAWSTARSFKTLPAAPVALSPVDNASVQVLRPAFTWLQTGTASKHELQVSALADFSALLASGSSTTLTWTPAVDLPRNAGLWWRARAVGAYGPSAWSIPAAFQTVDPPLPPTLAAPASGAVVAAAAHPTFSWKAPAISVPAGYHIQFSRLSNFSEILAEADLTATQYVFDGALPPNGLMYWRVRSYNGQPRQDSAYSGARSLKVLPSVPRPVSPVAAVATSLRPTLVWEAGANQPRYDLQVSKLSTCGSPFKSVTVSAAASAFSSDLARLATYYWRVRARGLYGISAWSPCLAFTTPDPPSVPALVSPAAGAVLPSTAANRPTLRWKASTNRPDGYIIQMWKGTTYNAATLVQQQVDDPAQTSLTWPDALAYGTYSWRVRSYRDGPVYSNWTAARVFKTPAGAQGTVTQYGSGAPLAGVKVTIYGTLQSAITGEDGVYRLPYVPAGKRRVIFSSSAHTSLSKTLTFNPGSLSTVNAALKKK